MNQYFNYKIAQQSAKIMAILLGCAHIWFAYFFFALGIEIMFYANILSVIYYFMGIFMLTDTNSMGFFVIFSMVELYLHLSVATVFVGLECGFQYVLILMPVMLYYIEYFWLEMTNHRSPVLIFSIISFFTFVALEIFVDKYGHIAEIPEWIEVPSTTSLLAFAFAFEAFFLHNFTKNTYMRERKLEEKALLDGLTGLYNRFDIWDELDGRLLRGELNRAWVAIVDLDDFKQVNNVYGRSSGDYVLLQVADVIRKQNPNFLCARWGGDSFLVLGRYNVLENEAYEAMVKLREEIAQIKYEMITEPLVMDVTIGIAFYKEKMTVKELISEADRRLNAGKYTGKNRIILRQKPRRKIGSVQVRIY